VGSISAHVLKKSVQSPGSKIGVAIDQNEGKRMTMPALRHRDGVEEASPDS
jgi:hypothetical protein